MYDNSEYDKKRTILRYVETSTQGPWIPYARDGDNDGRTDGDADQHPLVRVAKADQLVCLGGTVVLAVESEANSSTPVLRLEAEFQPSMRIQQAVACGGSDGTSFGDGACVATVLPNGYLYVESQPTSAGLGGSEVQPEGSWVSLDGLCWGGFVHFVEAIVSDTASISMQGGAYIEFG